MLRLAFCLCVLSAIAAAGALAPPAVQSSDLTVRLDAVGRIPAPNNPASPVVDGHDLLLLNQGGGLYRWDGTHAEPLLSARSVPKGITPTSREGYLAVAPSRSGKHLWVIFTSSTPGT